MNNLDDYVAKVSMATQNKVHDMTLQEIFENKIGYDGDNTDDVTILIPTTIRVCTYLLRRWYGENWTAMYKRMIMHGMCILNHKHGDMVHEIDGLRESIFYLDNEVLESFFLKRTSQCVMKHSEKRRIVVDHKMYGAIKLLEEVLGTSVASVCRVAICYSLLTHENFPQHKYDDIKNGIDGFEEYMRQLPIMLDMSKRAIENDKKTTQVEFEVVEE